MYFVLDPLTRKALGGGGGGSWKADSLTKLKAVLNGGGGGGCTHTNGGLEI